MLTEVLKINPQAPDPIAIEKAADILSAGGLVVFPTETVYGLGGIATDASAAQRIYAAKGRPSDNPLIVHIAEPEEAEQYAYTSDLYYRLARAFMPGPLTVILKKRDSVPFSVTGGLDTVALRCPAHPVANALIRKTGVGIAAPSANLSGKPSPTSAAHVIADLSGRVDLILDGGECEIGLESTIVALNDDGESVTLLRPGGITYDALLCVCTSVTVAPAVIEQLAENARPLSPGMKYRHYAPSAPLVLLSGPDESVLAFLRSAQKRGGTAVLCYNEEIPYLDPQGLLPVGARDDLSSQAKLLFSRLREADTLSPRIIYAHLPQKEGLGLALYNRMIRAAAHTIKEIP